MHSAIVSSHSPKIAGAAAQVEQAEKSFLLAAAQSRHAEEDDTAIGNSSKEGVQCMRSIL
jgi:hypothetical protein